MSPTIMKWISSATLLLATVFWSIALDYQLLLTVVVFLGAIVVLQQAVSERRFIWAGGFAVVALVFNPAAPLFQASGDWFRMTALVCTALFAISLTALKTRPALSIASITDRTPGSESL
jgi:Family of unknown function (DUF6804)